MKATLNHVGIAVTDLDQAHAMKKLFRILGLSSERSEERVEEQGVITHFIPFPAKPGYLELLEPFSRDGAVSKFLSKKGPGVHHLSFLVDKGELVPLCETLKKEGYRLIYDTPQRGAHSMRINFIHPASAGGILIEVMEPGEGVL